MWTRERLLAGLELAGFGAVATAAAGFGWLFGGIVAAISGGLLTGGLSAVYLAAAYSLGEDGDDER